MEWEKSLLTTELVEDLYLEYVSHFKNPNTRKTNNQIEKWGMELSREVSEEEMQMAKKYLKTICHP